MARFRQLAIVALADADDADLASVLLEETGFDVAACADSASIEAAISGNAGRVVLLVADEDTVDRRTADLFGERWPGVEIVRVPAHGDGEPPAWRPLDLLIRAESTRRPEP